MFRVTEDTLTPIFAEKLNKVGVKAITQTQFPTRTGTLIKPDIYLEQHRLAIQAKLGDRGKFVVALSQLWDCLEVGLEGGFVLTYNEQLKQVQTIAELEQQVEKLQSEVYIFIQNGAKGTKAQGSFSTLATWIAQQAPQRVKVEVPISNIIELVRKATEYLAGQLATISGMTFTDVFGGRNVFENILQYGEGQFPENAMRTATAYLLVNQMLFYHILSRLDPNVPKELDEIDPNSIGKPSDLLEYFRKARKRDYAAVFSFDIVSRLPEIATEPIVNIVKAFKIIELERIRHDLLGTVFHDLIPREVREPVAAYYTNITAAEMLADLAVESASDKIVDLAVGSGGLIVGAYRAKRRLSSTFTEEDHRKFVEEDITGIDIMPFAAHLAAVNLALQAPVYQTNKVRIAIYDSTTLRPGVTIPPVMKILRKAFQHGYGLTGWMGDEKAKDLGDEAYVEAGTYVLEGEKEEFTLNPADVAIMNPPFTRQERIPEDYKSKLDERFSDYALYSHGQLGYYGYFVFLADRFLKPGGRLALVVPATILRIQSCENLRKMLLQRYDFEAIVTTWQRAAFSEAAQFREILLLAKKKEEGQHSTSGPCLVVTLKQIPSTLEDALDLSHSIKQMRSETEPHEDGRLVVYPVSQNELDAKAANLYPLIAFKNKWLSDYWDSILETSKAKLTSTESFLALQGAEVLRGIESARGGVVQAMTILYNEERAVKNRDIWIRKEQVGDQLVAEDRFTHERVRIPETSIKPALRRVATINKLDISSVLDKVTVDRFPDLKKFLAASDVPQPRVGFWSTWKNYVQRRLTNLAIVRRADVSASGTCNLAFYSDVPMAPPGVAWAIKVKHKDDAKLLCLWFNSTLNLIQLLYNRKETRGAFIQLDEYVLNENLVPTLEALRSNKEELLRIFNEVRRTDFPSLLQQLETHFDPRMVIDRGILKALGAKKAHELPKVYDALAEEIQLLKQMMVGASPELEESED